MDQNVRLGLGCSRFGSLVRGLDRAGAARIVRTALDLGIRDFDTADIYGQGDSERFLGSALRGVNDARIVTKAGQTFSFAKRAIVPLKKMLRPIVARRQAMSSLVSNARATELPRDWSPTHLKTSLEKSLRRLGRSHVDLFLLHSPQADILHREEAMATLADLKREGKAVAIGASVDDFAALKAALADPRVEAVQFPLNQDMIPDPEILAAARLRGVKLIAREILGGATAPLAVESALRFASNQPVDIALLGTTNPERLNVAHKTMHSSQYQS